MNDTTGRLARRDALPHSRRKTTAFRPTTEGLEVRLLLAAGDLDTAFNKTGLAKIAISGFSFKGNAVAIQPDGKVLVAGTKSASVTSGTMAVARLKPDGSLDATFGGGVVSIPFNLHPSPNSDAYAVAVQPNGQILVVGAAKVLKTDGTSTEDFAVARLKADGTLDVSFGIKGIQTVGFDLGTATFNIDVAQAVAIQPDGKIVLAGYASHDSAFGGDQFAVTRLTSAGQLDTVFGPGGKKIIAFNRSGFKSDRAYAVAIQPDNKIVVAGAVEDSPSYDIGVARLTSVGELDTSFNFSGKQVVNFGAGHEYYRGVPGLAIQSDTKILVGGGDATADLARLTSSGAPDTTFDGDGRLTLAPPPGQSSLSLTGLAVQPDNKIVVGGQAGRSFGLARLNPSGSFDGSFGGSGQKAVAFDSTTNSVSVKGLVLQADNNIVVVADVFSSPATTSVARFQGATAVTVVIPAPSAPKLDPDSDTGARGDRITANAQPVLVGTAEAGRIVDILDASNNVLGVGIAAAGGAYSIRLASTLTLGNHDLRARARDAANHFSSPSGTFTVTIAASGIAPTLVVSIHGQFIDDNAIGLGAVLAAELLVPGASLLGPVLLGYDAYQGLPATGSGRNRDPWQLTIGTKIATILTDYYTAGTGGATAHVESLQVEWDTYGTESNPAKEVAARINQIVADTSHDGLPWDVLFVGYSRGGPFVNQVMSHIDFVNNPRIDYSEAILLDPTASRVSGDVFPDAIPAGLDREIHYDEGYVFPGTQLRFKVAGQPVTLVLLTEDGNTGNRIAGAEYRYVRAEVEQAVQSSGPKIPVGKINGYDSSRTHGAIPYWWSGVLSDEIGAPLRQDIVEFLRAKDQGAVIQGGKASVTTHTEVIRPTSSAANLDDPVNDLARQIARVAKSALSDAKALGGKIAEQAKAVVAKITKQAQQLAKDLIDEARLLGGEVLAAAKAQGAAILKKAKAEVAKINKAAKKAADQFLKSGKAFGKNATKELNNATKALGTAQQKASKAVATAQKQANKKVGEAKQLAQAKVESFKQKAAEETAKALAKVAAVGDKIVSGGEQLGGAIAGGYQETKGQIVTGAANVKKKLFGR